MLWRLIVWINRFSIIHLHCLLKQLFVKYSTKFLFFSCVVCFLSLNFPWLLEFTGTAAFDTEYGQWVEEQNRQTNDLRNALHHSQIGEVELRIIVDGCLNHYFDLFRVKATAAKADVLYIMSGMWKTSAERFFMWIGGFRPSELLKVMKLDIEFCWIHRWRQAYIWSFFPWTREYLIVLFFIVLN